MRMSPVCTASKITLYHYVASRMNYLLSIYSISYLTILHSTPLTGSP